MDVGVGVKGPVQIENNRLCPDDADRFEKSEGNLEMLGSANA